MKICIVIGNVLRDQNKKFLTALGGGESSSEGN